MNGHQGLRIDGADLVEFGGASRAAQAAQAVRAIVDYRGDMTITRRSTATPVTGYVFDCVEDADPARARVRLLPKDGGDKISISLADILAIEFTGRDTAAGKSFETWVKKYVQKKMAGETASLFSDDEPTRRSGGPTR